MTSAYYTTLSNRYNNSANQSGRPSRRNAGNGAGHNSAPAGEIDWARTSTNSHYLIGDRRGRPRCDAHHRQRRGSRYKYLVASQTGDQKRGNGHGERRKRIREVAQRGADGVEHAETVTVSGRSVGEPSIRLDFVLTLAGWAVCDAGSRCGEIGQEDSWSCRPVAGRAGIGREACSREDKRKREQSPLTDHEGQHALVSGHGANYRHISTCTRASRISIIPNTRAET